ncbi:MAG TPA: ion transporter [Tichowtungia sp.]|nr:ion transporter [Tichowtungia sp.]HKL27259.1 ion transporter [Desulfuromonadales bacterium]
MPDKHRKDSFGKPEEAADGSSARWRSRLHEIIFEADTPVGKFFDLVLILSILLSVLVVMLDSITRLNLRYGQLFLGIEWFFTLLFTVEYLLRLACVGRPLKYATSFYGIVDLLSILPTYLSLLLPGSQYLLSIRILRVLRIFRILKLATYVSEANLLARSLKASGRKIAIFLYTVLALVVIIGSAMYLVEGAQSGFTSIPRSIYWAIVTLTTVGYGDISPQTSLGQFLASGVMILGYSIIAVPTGIFTAEISKSMRMVSTQACPECSAEGHDQNAVHCKFCGAKL